MSVRIPSLHAPRDPTTGALHHGSPIMRFKDLDEDELRHNAWRVWVVLERLKEAQAGVPPTAPAAGALDKIAAVGVLLLSQ